MSTTVQVGSTSYILPGNSAAGGTWGEETAAFLVALTAKVNGMSSSYDILPASATIDNAASAATAISGLSFSSTLVKSAIITYHITRTVRESGTMIAIYDGSAWKLIVGPKIGISGVAFDITNAGQVNYASSSDIAGSINFSARVISV